MTAPDGPDSFVDAVYVSEVFADDRYQRPVDLARVRKMAAEWNRRLAGILEVSDRGENATPRYAVVDGQHRWAAAGLANPDKPLVAQIHTGLTVADEAALFDKLNRQRKQPTNWDHWKARRAAGDPAVAAIDKVAHDLDFEVTERVCDGGLWCISTIEKIAASAGGIELLRATLTIMSAAWGDQRAAYEAPLVHGIAMVLDTFTDRLDGDTLVETLSGTPPHRVRLQAKTMSDGGTPGSLAKLSALAILNLYNKKASRRLHWPHAWKGVLPKTRAPLVAPKPGPKPQARDTDTAAPTTFTTVAAKTVAVPERVPSSMPPVQPYTDDQADAVNQMEGRTVADIAAALNISERTVRRIHADLGIEGTGA